MVPHRAARAEYLNNFIDQAEPGGESSIMRLREQERLAPGDGAPGVRGLQGDGPPGDHITPSHIFVTTRTFIRILIVIASILICLIMSVMYFGSCSMFPFS